MSTKLILECDGCSEVVKGGPINRYKHPTYLTLFAEINKAIPAGWIWRDPYTHCTYCPHCWADIIDEDSEGHW